MRMLGDCKLGDFGYKCNLCISLDGRIKSTSEHI